VPRVALGDGVAEAEAGQHARHEVVELLGRALLQQDLQRPVVALRDLRDRGVGGGDGGARPRQRLVARAGAAERGRDRQRQQAGSRQRVELGGRRRLCEVALAGARSDLVGEATRGLQGARGVQQRHRRKRLGSGVRGGHGAGG
jgi:hypothetical protein